MTDRTAKIILGNGFVFGSILALIPQFEPGRDFGSRFAKGFFCGIAVGVVDSIFDSTYPVRRR